VQAFACGDVRAGKIRVTGNIRNVRRRTARPDSARSPLPGEKVLVRVTASNCAASREGVRHSSAQRSTPACRSFCHRAPRSIPATRLSSLGFLVCFLDGGGLRQDTRDAVLHEQAVLACLRSVTSITDPKYSTSSPALLRTGCPIECRCRTVPSGSTILYCCSYSVLSRNICATLCEHALAVLRVNQLAGLFELSGPLGRRGSSPNRRNASSE